ncbi:MAG: bacterial proteasome activator family protein [Acidimicrobiia bacterium]|nr:bacterial proteasome activator family protein [Acidimicrobiia bacterium]MDH3398904.1 bacterial proteasome activator family protein [Acidimicrobiia bacterium]MDH5616721.1 bacterial proteasome activator family protein [Acidimicrobiia bacterium]
MAEKPVRPEVVENTEDSDGDETVSQPSKLIRIASMTRATLDEVRQAPLDEAGRKRLLGIYQRSLDELKEVLSLDLRAELDEVFLPLTSEVPSESELRIAQAQLVGWLEGLFHGIQASLWTQQMAAQAQLAEVRQKKAIEGHPDDTSYPGTYL